MHGRFALGPLVALLAASPILAADPPGPVARLGTSQVRHAAPISSLAFSPDGKTLVSGGQDGTVRLWDVATGKQKLQIRRPDSPVSQLAYTHAGTRLAVRYFDTTIRFLDAVTLRELNAVEAPGTLEFAVSPDGKWLASVALGQVVVTDLATGLPQLELPMAALAVPHPDGKHVGTADAKGVVTLHRIVGGKPVFTADHGGPLNGLTFRADGTVFATGGTGSDGGVKLWEVGREKPLAEIAGSAGRVAFLPQNRVLAVKCFGHGVYDLTRREWVREFPDAAGVVAVSPDGATLAATVNGGVRVRLWDVATGKELHAADDFSAAALVMPTSDGKSLFAVGGTTASLWRVGEARATTAAKYPLVVMAAAVGGGRLVIATKKELAVWDGFDPARMPGKPTRTFPLGDAAVTLLAVSPDGKQIAYARADRMVFVIDAVSGKDLHTITAAMGVLDLAFIGNNGLLVFDRSHVRRWQLGGGERKEAWQVRVPRGSRGSLAVSPDGKHVATATASRLLVLDAATGERVAERDRPAFDAQFTCAAFTPDGRFLVTGTDDGDDGIQLWKTADWTEAKRLPTGGGVTRLAVFPDGSRVATVAPDESVTVWAIK